VKHSSNAQVIVEEEKKSAAIIQVSLLEMLGSFIQHMSNPDAVLPNRSIIMLNQHTSPCKPHASGSLRDSLVLFAQQYSMQNCFLCLQPPSSSSSESALPDERPCRPLTSLPSAAAATGVSLILSLSLIILTVCAAIYTGRCIVWFAVNKVPPRSTVTLKAGVVFVALRFLKFARVFAGRFFQRQFVG
jgi:hypothetical protein